MSNVVKRAVDEQNQVVLEILRDEYPESPRTWDNVGTMVCFHHRYNLGDEHDYSSPTEFLYHLALELAETSEDEEVIEEAYASGLDSTLKDYVLNHQNIVIFPVFLLDHSGLRISIDPFGCSWDSGQVGWIYVTKDKIVEEFGDDDEEARKKAEEYLRWEVKAYDQYLCGGVYGFSIQKITECPCCGAQKQEHIDFCWGFYGDEFDKNGLYDHIPDEYKHLVEQLEDVY